MQNKLLIPRRLLLVSFFCGLMFSFFSGNAQEVKQSESSINDEYHEIIMKYLRSDVAKRQANMNDRAKQMLLSLPNEQKLYDESEVMISAKLQNDVDADGNPELNYVITLTYNCKNTEGASDDYASGQYLLEKSNSATAISNIARAIIEQDNNDIFAAGRDVTIRVASATDAEPITHLNYLGEYGQFRYEAVQHNAKNIRVSVNMDEGITTNEQLAFLRAQGLKQSLEDIPSLMRTNNSYLYATRCYSEKGSQYRRCGVEFTVHKPFDELMHKMREKLINDEFIEYNIPVNAENSNMKTYVVIVANEAYEAPISNCRYAYRDGLVMKEYFVKTLGVPERHVKVLNNASIPQIKKKGIKWLQDITKAQDGDVNIVVYYSGHGLTDATYRPYLIPCGMDLRNVKQWAGKSEIDPTLILNKHDTKALLAECLPLDTLCSWFDRVNKNNLAFILDCSFNGIDRSGETIVDIPKTVERMKGMRLRGDICIFAAANFDKTAFAFEDQQHGFLTYYIMKELKRTKGDITYGELFNNVKKAIRYESSLEGKLQEPTMILGGKMKDDWSNTKF